MQFHRDPSRPDRRSCTRALAMGALLFGVTLSGSVTAQDVPSIPRGIEPAPQVVLEGEDVPNYLVNQHFYDHLLWALAEGHGTWTRYALTPLGVEPGTKREAALETFLLEVRDTVSSRLHVGYDTEIEHERFQQDQLAFRWQKMAAMAVVHAEMLELLEQLGVGTQGMLEFIEREIRPGITVLITGPREKSAVESRAREDEIFGFYDEVLTAARRGAELPSPQRRSGKASSSADVLSLSGYTQFPNCGEGLVSRRGRHSLTLVNKDRATTLTLSGQLKECNFGFFDSFVGTACGLTAVATASGQTISCVSTASDTLCRAMDKHRAWQEYYVQRNGLPPLHQANQSSCTKPSDCDDFYPPPR